MPLETQLATTPGEEDKKDTVEVGKLSQARVCVSQAGVSQACVRHSAQARRKSKKDCDWPARPKQVLYPIIGSKPNNPKSWNCQHNQKLIQQIGLTVHCCYGCLGAALKSTHAH